MNSAREFLSRLDSFWTDTERVQEKREPFRGIATTTSTYFVWRCDFDAPGILLPHILRPCFLKSKPLSRYRFPQLGTDKCTINHMQFTSVLTPWSNVPSKKLVVDHLIKKLYPHFVETESLLASKQRDCSLPSLYLQLSMHNRDREPYQCICRCLRCDETDFLEIGPFFFGSTFKRTLYIKLNIMEEKF